MTCKRVQNAVIIRDRLGNRKLVPLNTTFAQFRRKYPKQALKVYEENKK